MLSNQQHQQGENRNNGSSSASSSSNNVKQEPQHEVSGKTYAQDFDAWLNESSSSPYPSSEFRDYFSMKEDKQKDILIFHHDKDHPPDREEREFPDRKDPTVKKRSTRAVFKVSRWSEPDRIRTWEVAKTTAQTVWPMIRDEGLIVFEVTRNGKPNDPTTTYAFVPKIQLQKQKIEGERSSQQKTTEGEQRK